MSSKLIRCSALAGMLGGLMWALFPFGTPIASIKEMAPGTPAYYSSVAYYWLLAVVPLLLLVIGLIGFRALHKDAYGRLGRVGFIASLFALTLMFAGNVVEMASLTFSGSESAAGHSVFLIGFLLLLVGSVPLGIAIARLQRENSSRISGLLMVGALPLGILLAVSLGAAAPETDLGFWAAITVPYGIAWAVLGHAFRSRRGAATAGPAPRVA